MAKKTSDRTPRSRVAAASPRLVRTRVAPAKATATKAGDLTEAIRTRAYFLWLERGAGDADDLGDWLQAERELSEVRVVRRA